ncbi:MAG: hypothetical protein ACJ8CR_29855 [Roseiflexaceae bacterium]
MPGQHTPIEAPCAVAVPPVTTLRGRRLRLARTAWLVVALPTIGLYLVGVPVYFAYLLTPCPDTTCMNGQLAPDALRALHALGLSVGFYAAYTVALDVVVAAVYGVVAMVLFWYKSDDRMALFAALTLLTFGSATFTSSMQMLAEVAPVWWFPVSVVGFIGDVGMLTFLYLFPDGRFVPRWTRWLALLWIAYQVPVYFFPQSPAALSGTWLGQILFPTLIGSGAAAQVYRYWRISSPVQRQQTKWVVFGSATGIALDVIIVAVAVTGILPWAVEPGSLPYFVGLTGAFLALLLIPLSIGVAMLRYRLWDIDLLINRTLLYGGLTVALGLVYLSGVVVLQAVFRTLTGQGQSPLVTIGSTLTIAALFNPLRRRLQTWIDQRFFRRKYDAAKTLAAFGAKMRDETDLNALLADLLRVVAETMQPTHSSLWLRPPERKVRRQAYGNDP